MVSAFSSLSVFGLAALALSGTSVDAHGTLSKPALKFTGSGYGGNFAALVPMTALKAQPGDIFTNYPSAAKNAAAFDRAFKAAGHTTLKEFLLKNQDMSKGRTNMPKTPECGFTDPTGGPTQEPPAELEWYGGQMNHDGPCEVWCDNEIVLPFTANCAQTYPQGKFKYDRAKCVGKSRLTMYWMSTLMEWQVYIQCAKLGGGNAAPAPASGTTTRAPAPAPAPGPAPGPAPATPSAPALTPATRAPAPGSAPTRAPAPAPAPTKNNGGQSGGEAGDKPGCKRRMRS